MTVIYQQDERIRVDDPHDALLLSLAGVELTLPVTSTYYVPAEVAKDLVVADFSVTHLPDSYAYWALGEFTQTAWFNNFGRMGQKNQVTLRYNQNKWHILPDITLDTNNESS